MTAVPRIAVQDGIAPGPSFYLWWSQIYFLFLLLVCLVSYLRNCCIIKDYKDVYLCFLSFVATSFIFYVSLTVSYLKLSSVHTYLSFFSCFPFLCFQVFDPFIYCLASWLLILSATPTNHLITCSLLLACSLFMLPPRALHFFPLHGSFWSCLFWRRIFFVCLLWRNCSVSFQVFFRGNYSI